MSWWIYGLAVVGGCALVVIIAAVVVGWLLTRNAEAFDRPTG